MVLLGVAVAWLLCVGALWVVRGSWAVCWAVVRARQLGSELGGGAHASGVTCLVLCPRGVTHWLRM